MTAALCVFLEAHSTESCRTLYTAMVASSSPNAIKLLSVGSTASAVAAGGFSWNAAISCGCSNAAKSENSPSVERLRSHSP